MRMRSGGWDATWRTDGVVVVVTFACCVVQPINPNNAAIGRQKIFSMFPLYPDADCKFEPLERQPRTLKLSAFRAFFC